LQRFAFFFSAFAAAVALSPPRQPTGGGPVAGKASFKEQYSIRNIYFLLFVLFQTLSAKAASSNKAAQQGGAAPNKVPKPTTDRGCLHYRNRYRRPSP
jgi:hypothetical protein